MTKPLYFILFLLCSFPALVSAQCQLNQYGYNICTDEYALWEKNEKSFTKVKVVQLKYYETVIKEGRDILTTNINELIGTKICQDDDQYCVGSTITISPTCQMDFKEDEYKIKEVFQNGIIESEEGNFFNRKSILIPSTCIKK